MSKPKLDKKLQSIIDSMPKFQVEPPETIELDKEALQSKYDVLIDLVNSRKLTDRELKIKAAIEHYMTCDDPTHMHGAVYTYYDSESEV